MVRELLADDPTVLGQSLLEGGLTAFEAHMGSSARPRFLALHASA
jgi:hypothetical protein